MNKRITQQHYDAQARIAELESALSQLFDYADGFSVLGFYLSDEIEGQRVLKNAAAALEKSGAYVPGMRNI